MSLSVLRPSSMFSTWVYRVSWHLGGVSKKNYSHSFLTVFNFSITPQSIALKFARLPITRSPIPCSSIVRSATLTPRSLFINNHSLPDCLLAPTHPVPSLLLSNLLPDCLIALHLILEKYPQGKQIIIISAVHIKRMRQMIEEQEIVCWECSRK